MFDKDRGELGCVPGSEVYSGNLSKCGRPEQGRNYEESFPAGSDLPFFLLGTIIPAAVAGSYQSAWITIFGLSTSCGLGAASINDSTFKVGAASENRVGCSHSNAYRSVPPYYLGARVVAYNPNAGITCGDSGLDWNTSTAPSKTNTVPLIVGSFCVHGAGNTPIRGEGTTYRDTDSSGLKVKYPVSPTRYF